MSGSPASLFSAVGRWKQPQFFLLGPPTWKTSYSKPGSYICTCCTDHWYNYTLNLHLLSSPCKNFLTAILPWHWLLTLPAECLWMFIQSWIKPTVLQFLNAKDAWWSYGNWAILFHFLAFFAETKVHFMSCTLLNTSHTLHSAHASSCHT